MRWPEIKVTKISYSQPIGTGECLHDRVVAYNFSIGYQRHVDDGSSCNEMIKTRVQELSKDREKSL